VFLSSCFRGAGVFVFSPSLCRYVDAFGQVAKKGTTMLLPHNAADPASMVATAMGVFEAVRNKNGPAAPGLERSGGGSFQADRDHDDDDDDEAAARDFDLAELPSESGHGLPAERAAAQIVGGGYGGGGAGPDRGTRSYSTDFDNSFDDRNNRSGGGGGQQMTSILPPPPFALPGR
jgi:hypothetical protein